MTAAPEVEAPAVGKTQKVAWWRCLVYADTIREPRLITKAWRTLKAEVPYGTPVNEWVTHQKWGPDGYGVVDCGANEDPVFLILHIRAVTAPDDPC